MSALPDWLLPLMGGNTIISATLGWAIPAMVTRKKDAGDQANDLIGRLSVRLEAVEKGHETCQKETAALRAISVRNDIVIRLVVPELQRVAPYSSSLQQARDLLGAAFPVSIETPADMLDMLDKIDPSAR